jgi:hypothetical protein
MGSLAAVIVLAAFVDASPVRAAAPASDSLVEGFANPPRQARLRAYWWWLNGNVTKAAITRDLEEMAAKGFGGALICDAGGAEQEGNNRVPHGPDFFSPEWRELYKHTLREADRLGLEMSLNIQSGWNLGGPMVKAEDAPKKLVWSETRVKGPTQELLKLPEPKHPPQFYRDVAVVAYPVKTSQARALVRVSASSAQSDHPADLVVDGDADTFWVSRGLEQGEGPTTQRPEWLQFSFPEAVPVATVSLHGRPGYGPQTGELQSSDDGTTWRRVKAFSIKDGQELTLAVNDAPAAHFRLLFFRAFDTRFPQAPRNVQVAEVKLLGKDGQVFTSAQPQHRPLLNWDKKALIKALNSSAPDTSPLLQELPAEPNEEDTHASQVLDLTDKMDAAGTLRWEPPAGEWEILRFGCTLNDHCRVSTCSDGWQGYAIDPFDAGAFRRYWDTVVEPLIADAGPLAGRVFKYLHTDSWEVEVANWTPTLRQEFRTRRGYDLLPYLPVIAGRIVDSRPVSNRFLNDFRRTMGDLAVDNHYRLFVDGAHRHGMQIHPESGGPHAVPVDAQQCLGMDDAPMSEFWAWSWTHRVGDENRFFVKQPASAAHTYGHKLVLAEGFTSIGPHWQETLWDNLKPAFDKALCEGMNRLVWHAFVCSPAAMGLPGQQYFAGTHLNPNVTWWSKSAPFFAYLNRCQYLLQQGQFVADVAYYYGDHVPNFAQLKRSDPAHILPGYDYDVVTEEVILTRMTVHDGRLTLPDGMSYRVLVLPNRPNISLPVLRKLKEFVTAGATIIGPKPQYATSLTDFPKCDQEVTRLADELWGSSGGSLKAEGLGDGLPVDAQSHPQAALEAATHHVGKGRVIRGQAAREVLTADGVKPDFAFSSGDPNAALDYIHRSDGSTEVYFVANRSTRPLSAVCTFRVTNKPPQVWDPITAQAQRVSARSVDGAGTTLKLDFPPCGSLFVIFRPATGTVSGHWEPRIYPVSNRLKAELQTLPGPWTVRFDPNWGGPGVVSFPQLVSWTQRPEEGIKFYSGTAVYETSFDLPPSLRDAKRALALDLGKVKELAEVRLNGKNLGVLWAPPFRVDVTGVVQPTGNRLEVEVVNFWPNRIIGDQSLPPEKRLTRTNITKLTKTTPLIESGLLGPVTVGTVDNSLDEEASSGKTSTNHVTVAAYYFPNYHRTDPRNALAKGAGWCEWELVKGAQPRFPGHEQPKVPLWGYTDESDPKVMEQKIAAAADHGIDAFIYDWYFYEDGPFLQHGLEDGFMKAANNGRLKFGLMWANHDWVDIFPARLQQTPQLVHPGKVTPAGFDRMADYVIATYFHHPSCWLLDGKPYFSIYEIGSLVQSFGSVEATRAALDRFHAKTQQAGLPGLHLNAVVWGSPILPGERTPTDPAQLVTDLGFDSITSYTWVHHAALDFPKTEYATARDRYLTHFDLMLKQFRQPYFPNASMGWDPTPRTEQSEPWGRGNYPFTGVIVGNTPAAFHTALQIIKDKLLAAPTQPKVVTINCWNEWTEGSYLEPDTTHGLAYLQAVKEVFATARVDPKVGKTAR